MTRVTIDPGVCGMSAVIEVDMTGKLEFKIKITSACEKVSAACGQLSNISLGDALRPHIHSPVYKCASEYSFCASCSVLVGILKALEVEAGVALPQPVSIKFDTEDQK
jgi:hypothetical protein